MSMNHDEALSLSSSAQLSLANLNRFDLKAGELGEAPAMERRLSDVQHSFADGAEVTALLTDDDPLIYTVSTLELADGEGDLHVGLGRIMPGRVGDEYFLTKGHLHTWRAAAEVYVGLAGAGVMLLEDEEEHDSRVVELLPNSVVYVPGRTAHRTVNTGSEPLSYLGVYPARAGHDYGFIADRNFRNVVIAGSDGPQVLNRRAFLAGLGGKR